MARRSLLLLSILGVASAARMGYSPRTAPSFANFFGREEIEEEEEADEGPLSGAVGKAIIGAGVAAVGSAGAFAYRAMKSKLQRGSKQGGPLGEAAAVKGGKSEAKGKAFTAPEKPAAAAAGAAAAAAKGAAAAVADKGAKVKGLADDTAEEEEEEVFEVEEIVTLDEAALTQAQREHPLAKALGAKLVRYDEKQGKLVEVPTADALKGKTIGLFFHAQQVEAVLEKMKAGRALPPLKDIYKATKAAGNDFEMVFVGLPDGQEGRWQHYVKDMPWFAVPHSATDAIKEIYRKYRVQNFPSVMILDDKGTLLNEKGYTYMLLDRAGFPWKAQTPQEMIGDSFITRDNETLGADAVSTERAKVLGLYFSASWCKPCREFTPRLAELYTKFNTEGKDFEVVLVSMDEDEAKYREYLNEMPWLSVPLEDKQRRSLLMMEYEVRSLPTLILLDEDRKVITTRGREFALKDPDGGKFPWRPEPLNEVSFSVEGIGQKPAVCVFMEGASGDAQEKMVADLQRMAEDYAAKAKEQPETAKYKFGFYYAKEISTISKALRAVIGLEQISPKDKFLKSKAEANKPLLVILDIAKEMYAVSDADEINEESIQAMMDARLDGTLAMEPFKQPEPAEDADGTGAPSAM